ncbi:MAG: type II toxin-antitoxin system PemK/MazF family toxin [Gemmatimonadales bacterium]|jgi:mRNA interferase MazF
MAQAGDDPDEMNRNIGTVIMAPMTTKSRAYSRVRCRLKKKDVHVVLAPIRTVDRQRLVRRLGKLPASAQLTVLDVLAEMFAP